MGLLRATALGCVWLAGTACSLAGLDDLASGKRAAPDGGLEASVEAGSFDASKPPVVDAKADAVDADQIADAGDVEGASDLDAAGCYLADGLSPVLPENTDGVSYEIGTRVRPNVDVIAKKMRFWKSPSEPSADRVGTLWTANGSIVVTATLVAGAESGWIEATFPTPVALAAGQDYVVSARVSSFYPTTLDFFAAGDVTCPSGKLVAPKDAADAGPPNGVYGPAGALPTQSYRSSFYFIDLYVE